MAFAIENILVVEVFNQKRK